MPEVLRHRNKGGQRRTIEAGCGWRCVGHPTEVDKKYLIHKRHCNVCGENAGNLPAFNTAGGQVNGWNGLKRGKNGSLIKIDKMLSTTFVEGLRRDILVENVNTFQKANDKAIDIILAEATPPLPISASKKKRMKQKAKKEAGLYTEITNMISKEAMDKFCEVVEFDTDEEITEKFAELIGDKMTDKELDKFIEMIEEMTK